MTHKLEDTIDVILKTRDLKSQAEGLDTAANIIMDKATRYFKNGLDADAALLRSVAIDIKEKSTQIKTLIAMENLEHACTKAWQELEKLANGKGV